MTALLPLAAQSAPGDSDLKQARELLAMSQSSIKDYDLLIANGGTDPAVQAQFVNYVTFAREALPALRRSAAAGNAAGQYLLALTLRIPIADNLAEREEVCDQMIRSAAQHFLPAVLVGPAICQEQMAQLDIQDGLVQALEQASRDAGYYPIQFPGYRLCGSNPHAAFPLPELTQKELEVEAYYDLALRTKEVDRASQDRKLVYLRNARDRGCEHADQAVTALEGRLK
ncbi:hypothetical protein NK553_08285 [Pseudomonas sp. ZM23]|uniref:Uncharacterized protein n=1 Tax=Pseudomonas triclosanedens TaxID=2961893 RepID=A0ABY7A1X4_9PSED|nr:hypothetical protein [Pseudomonas triclosanedens]MCP8463939.1 hypothetical protein [Pseudomonas triclosanedens]MCP8469023.1 hypothetical protein [Pseudomonas triclosanedens]MCP8475745.1 hypothetical protein [Pseudomonas triclosanedens]WAI50546.1 hypothetical protein OU419_04565 [Pseudomonas triclosanedens]